MASFLFVSGLVAVWIFVAVVTGLIVGGMVRMRDRQRPGAAPRRPVDVVAIGRPVVLGDVVHGG